MLNINIIDDLLLIKNINKDSIKNIYSIYKNTGDFKYATGVFDTIDYNEFSYQISQFILRPSVFFLDICLLATGENIGFIKGSMVKKNNILWINSLGINTQHQSKGYGKKVIGLLEDYFRKKCDIQSIYLSVYKNNNSGIKFWTKCNYKKCDYLFSRSTESVNERVQFMWKTL